jgi:hypothetical protein
MRMRNLPVALVVAALVSTLPVIQALAQPPSNDTRAGAVSVTSVPFIYEEDTSEATASGPKFCSNNGSVFFKFHATSDLDLAVDTFGSDYDTVLAVFTKTAGAIDQIGCSDDAAGFTSAVRFHADAGTTYVFMVGFCCGNGQSGGGGNLVFSVSEQPTTPLAFSAGCAAGWSVRSGGSCSSTGTCGSGGETCSWLVASSPRPWCVTPVHRRLGTRTPTRRQASCSEMVQPESSGMRPSRTVSSSRSRTKGRGWSS